MRGRYLSWLLAGILGVSNICYASIPKDITPKSLENKVKVEAPIENEDGESSGYLEAARHLSRTKWYDFGTMYVGERFHLDLNKIVGKNIKCADPFTTMFNVEEGVIDYVPLYTDRSRGKLPEMISITYESVEGDKGQIILKGFILKKPQN